MLPGRSLDSEPAARVTTSAEIVTDLVLMTSTSSDDIPALERALGNAGDGPSVVYEGISRGGSQTGNGGRRVGSVATVVSSAQVAGEPAAGVQGRQVGGNPPSA